MILWAQWSAMIGAWVFVAAVFWSDSGLGFQGDAPRHAANGAFWRDFLTEPTLDAKTYALRYYARYPAINPVTYPPVFYLAEGLAYSVCGVSAWAAKGTVLTFALLAGIYALLWLRRWVSPEAGWLAGLLLLAPGMARWSNAVMLNAPAAALAVAALYHARRWLEDERAGRRSRHLYLTAAFGVLASLTWLPTGYIALVVLTWALGVGVWRALLRRRVIVTAALSVLLVSPWLWIVWRYAPVHLGWAGPDADDAMAASTWAFYAGALTELMNGWVLGLAGLGVVLGLASARRRRETALLLSWVVIGYVAFSLMSARESRYVLSLVMPLIGLAAIAVTELWRLTNALCEPRRRVAAVVRLAAPAALLAISAVNVTTLETRRVSGFDEVAAYFRDVAPDEPVFYDGYHNGVFTFHVLANDPDRLRRVAVGHKSLYTSALRPVVELQEFVATREQVIERLREQVGCRWLAIEIGSSSREVAAARLLREAVQEPPFEFVRSFAVSGAGAERVDVYRLIGPVAEVDEVELPFLLLGGERYTVKPIE